MTGIALDSPAFGVVWSQLTGGSNAASMLPKVIFFEVWARIKFEGPRFPHAKPGDKDAIYIERVVLVNSE